MKTEAYKCDSCGNLMTSVESVGVSTSEDMFDKLSSYPAIFKPEKAEVHFCINCYNAKVAIPASNLVNRKADEQAYKRKLEELAFGLRSQCVRNHRDRIRGKKLG